MVVHLPSHIEKYIEEAVQAALEAAQESHGAMTTPELIQRLQATIRMLKAARTSQVDSGESLPKSCND